NGTPEKRFHHCQIEKYYGLPHKLLPKARRPDRWHDRAGELQFADKPENIARQSGSALPSSFHYLSNSTESYISTFHINPSRYEYTMSLLYYWAIVCTRVRWLSTFSVINWYISEVK